MTGQRQAILHLSPDIEVRDGLRRGGLYVTVHPSTTSVSAIAVKSDWGASAHCTAMVAVFEVIPFMEITTGTALPAATPVGTGTLTWYRPT